MKILSLFDGIACGRVALERAGIKVDKYYASEIDKYAIQVAMKNYPDIIQLGDINNYDNWELPEIDMIIGGSPCQDLSIATQNRQGLNGSRSGLFYKYVECLKKFKPKYFLLENNYSMPKESKDEITRIMGVEPIMINSALVSAQSRKRYYWHNIPKVTHPNDKGIILQDILESGIIDKEKSYCLKHQAGNTRDYFKKHHTQIAYEPVGAALRTYPRMPNGEPRVKRPEIRSDEKSNCLTSVQTDSMVCEPMRIGDIGSTAQAHRVYSIQGKSVTINSGGGGQGGKTGLYKVDLPDGDYIIRKLTPIECERLQTLPDNYTAGISDTQRYKALGNGWTVDAIAHILSFIDCKFCNKCGDKIVPYFGFTNDKNKDLCEVCANKLLNQSHIKYLQIQFDELEKELKHNEVTQCPQSPHS